MKHHHIALKTRSGKTVFAGSFAHHTACIEAAIRQKISLDYIDLSGISLRNCTMDGVSMRHADLRGCDLTSSNISECDLQDSLLDEARLVDVCLAETRLDRASLRHAQFWAAIMYDASLHEAVVTLQTAKQIPWQDIAPNWPVYLEAAEGMPDLVAHPMVE